MGDDPKADPRFVVVPNLTDFQQGGILWAVNQFLLWPLGLALSVVFDTETGRAKGPIELREWEYPDNHLETIEDSSEQPDFDRWVAFCATIEERLARMPLVEREAAARRLGLLGIPVSMTSGKVTARELTRPAANWVPPV
jgi:hypothetical protein